MIYFTKDICGDFRVAIEKEWLETNGLGGYASSTIIGVNTRRYHGLLVAAVYPPVGRVVMLSKVEETLVVRGHTGDRRYELSCNYYAPGVIHPEGYRYLEAFRMDPFPVFTYTIPADRHNVVRLEKSVCMVHGENTTIVQYRLLDSLERVRLEVRPFVAFRDYYTLTHENDAIRRSVETDGRCVTFRPYADLPPVHFAHDAEAFEEAHDWYRNFFYQKETERGLDDREDLFCYGVFNFLLEKGIGRALIVSTNVRKIEEVGLLTGRERIRREKIVRGGTLSIRFGRSAGTVARVGGVTCDEAIVTCLLRAADSFLVRRRIHGAAGFSVIAGYHWFGDWGRDTMISLPGMTFITGRFEEAKAVLSTFARYADRGMLPNRFPDSGEVPEYNTVDAALWMFHAVDRYLAYTRDTEFVKQEMLPVLQDAIRWYREGTRYGIRMDEQDGLLIAGEEGTQLTWMDAKVGDWVVTPRWGKAVEINAMWYNALRVMESLSQQVGEEERGRAYREMAERVERSFGRVFWNDEQMCLYDVVGDGWHDASIRPNQIFAVSLPYRLLSVEKERAVVEVVQRELLTPYGLRSLAPDDPAYIGRYEGDQYHRDGAYHRGTVWAWLIGPFVTAYVHVNGKTEAARQEAFELLKPLILHLTQDAGLGSVSEIFDGDPPHTPRGCIAQAWSVAEVLRAYVEDVIGRRPAQSSIVNRQSSIVNRKNE
jgi:predicted glycogen debranching enzyme